MSLIGQNVLTETVEYLDNGSIFDAVVTKKIAALNTATESNIDLFLGATGRINLNIKGYNALRFQQKSDDDKTTQVNLINNQGLEIISGDNSRTTIISDVTFTQTATKHQLKSSKGIIVLDDDVEITGNLTTTQDFLTGGAIVASSTNVMREFSNNTANTTIGFGFRVDDTSNLELYKFDNSTNVTKKVFTFGVGEVTGIQDTNSFPIFGNSLSNINSGVQVAGNKIDTLWSSNGTDIYYNYGRIGVGTTVPLYTGHFQGTVYAKDGFSDGFTTTNGAGSLTTTTLNATHITTNDGSGINNLTAQNITIGKLQTAVMPNIINTQEVYTDKIDTDEVICNGDIYFTGNIYRNQELLNTGGGYWGYSSTSNVIYYTAGNVGIGTLAPKVSLDVYGSDAIKIPVGTTFQRPSNNIGNGMLRYNSTTKQFEGFSGNNWAGLGGVIDVNQDTYISAETVPGSNNDELIFYTSNIQRMIINSNGNIGINTTTPSVSLDINSTNAIKMPVGTSAQRPIASTGMLRYNTTSKQFEGYGDTSWTGLGGVIDLNQDTYISAENSPGSNNDELKFYTSNIQRMIINKDGSVNIASNLRVNGNFDVGGTLNYINTEQIVVEDKIIQLGSTTTGTSNLNGAGFVIGSNNQITFLYNDTTSSFMLNKTLNITSTDAIKMPAGTTAQRPAASTGMIRYNTSTTQFEGFSAGAWSSIGGNGGLIDANQDTYISAEIAPGSNNDELRFYTSNVQRMIINSTGNVGIGTLTPSVALDIRGTSAIQIPAGTDLQRPNGTQGMIRYNTNTMVFEGFSSGTWNILGSSTNSNNSTIADTNKDTYIQTETAPGSNNDEIKFFTAGVQRMNIAKTGEVSANGTLYATDLYSSNSIFVLNNIQGGSVTASNITVAQTLTTSNLTTSILNTTSVATDLIPTQDTVYNLGSTSKKWKDLYLSGNSIYLGDTIMSRDASTGSIAFKDRNNPTIRRSVIVDQIQIGTASDKLVTLNVSDDGYLNIKNNSAGVTTKTQDPNWLTGANSNVYLLDKTVSIGSSSKNNYQLYTTSSNQEFKVCSSNKFLEIGSKTSGTKMEIDSLGNTTTKGTFRVKPSSDSLNYSSSNTTFATIMNNINYYTNFSNLTIPNTIPITMYSSNILYANSNVTIEFKASAPSILQVSSSLSSIQTSFYNTDTVNYKSIAINSNNYFTFIGSNLLYDVNILTNIGTAKLGIGTTDVLTKSFEVIGDSSLTGTTYINGQILLNGNLLDINQNDSVFTKTASNLCYLGHNATVQQVYNTSNIVSTTSPTTLMNLTRSFANLSNLNFPSNLPITYINNYLVKANIALNINLSANLDGAEAYVSTSPSNSPVFIYSAGPLSNLNITVPVNYYLAVLGV